MRTTDLYFTKIEVFNNAIVDCNLRVQGNAYSNTWPLFESEFDVDYATITMRLTVLRIPTHYATVYTSISSPFFNWLNTVNAANINCGNATTSTVGGNLM